MAAPDIQRDIGHKESRESSDYRDKSSHWRPIINTSITAETHLAPRHTTSFSLGFCPNRYFPSMSNSSFIVASY